jgi:hypothetical protein
MDPFENGFTASSESVRNSWNDTDFPVKVHPRLFIQMAVLIVRPFWPLSCFCLATVCNRRFQTVINKDFSLVP